MLNVQSPLPARIKRIVGAGEIAAYHGEEAAKVLNPIKRFLDRHGVPHRCEWLLGSPVAEIVRVSKREGAHLLVMGTHGHGLIGRALMGSIAQRVVAECDIPVLLVK